MAEPGQRTSDRGSPPHSEEHVDAIAACRAVIERARGLLMFVYGIDESTALELLTLRSRSTRIDLPTLAEQILNDFASLTPQQRNNLQAACDQILITVNERVDQGW